MTTNDEYIDNFKSALSQMIRAYEKVMDKYGPEMAVKVQCFMLASLAAKQDDPNKAFVDIQDVLGEYYTTQIKGMSTHLT